MKAAGKNQGRFVSNGRKQELDIGKGVARIEAICLFAIVIEVQIAHEDFVVSVFLRVAKTKQIEIKLKSSRRNSHDRRQGGNRT